MPNKKFDPNPRGYAKRRRREDHCKPDPLQRIEQSLHELHHKVDHMRADVEQLRKDFDTETTRIAALQESEIAELQALRDQLATMDPAAVGKALDEVIAGMTPIAERLKAVGASPTEPIPPV